MESTTVYVRTIYLLVYVISYRLSHKEFCTGVYLPPTKLGTTSSRLFLIPYENRDLMSHYPFTPLQLLWRSLPTLPLTSTRDKSDVLRNLYSGFPSFTVTHTPIFSLPSSFFTCGPVDAGNFCYQYGSED